MISKPLVVSNCPLPFGACTWKHRTTGQCKYTEKELTANELAALVGESPLPEEKAVEIKEELRAAIKESLR